MSAGGTIGLKIAVYTAVTGAYDALKPVPSTRFCDFICYTDEPVDARGWENRLIAPSDLDSTRRAREVKLRPHRYLAEYDVSIWVDGSILVTRDPAPLVQGLSWDDPLYCYRHPSRDSLIQEAEACIAAGKDDSKVIERQLAHYKSQGCPMEGNVIESNVLLRRHNEADVVAVMELWWEQVRSWSKRDQLAFGYAAWAGNLPYQFMGEANARGRSKYFLVYDHAGSKGTPAVWQKGGIRGLARSLRNAVQPY